MKVSRSTTEPSSQTNRSLTKRRLSATTACRMILGLTLMLTVMTSVGCFLPIYSARPERRVQQLLFTSDNLRQIVDDWERFWQLDSPSHMSPIRTHGGIL